MENKDCRWGYVTQALSLQGVTLYFSSADDRGERISVTLSRAEAIKMLKALNESLIR